MNGGVLGSPRLHLRLTASTNDRARELATLGAPHGTLVTASEQSAGRGRQGRSWTAPPGRALLCSIVLRDPPPLASLIVGVATASVVGPTATLKWPNDVLLDRRKVAGILIEARLQEHWVVAGIGLNVAMRPADFPEDLRDRAGTLGLEPDAIEPTLEALLLELERWLAASPGELLNAVRARDALLGQPVRWADGHGQGGGIDGDGQLIVITTDGTTTLNAGEVHLADLDH